MQTKWHQSILGKLHYFSSLLTKKVIQAYHKNIELVNVHHSYYHEYYLATKEEISFVFKIKSLYVTLKLNMRHHHMVEELIQWIFASTLLNEKSDSIILYYHASNNVELVNVNNSY